LTIFITGGAGYIGSHVTSQLAQLGIFPTVIDNLSGANLFPKIKGARYIDLALDSEEAEQRLFFEFERAYSAVVIHLAGLKSVEKSMKDPELYSRMNLGSTEKLINAMREAEVRCFVFASSAAVYGVDAKIATEQISSQPLSNYGKVKLQEEKLIQKRLKHFSILRFFNVIGAMSKEFREKNGENIFPTLAKCISNKEVFKIFGNDYPTIDGTCVRDYIDVRDIAYAVVKSVDKGKASSSDILNISSNRGTSVLQIVDSLSRHFDIDYKFLNRREGDVPEIIGINAKAKHILKWEPKISVEESLESSFL